MSIEVHCPQCSRLIRAPDSAGGKRGKCPYCETSVYIPLPESEDEVIGLAPIDEEAERRDADARREALEYVASVDKARDFKPDKGGSAGPPAAESPVPPGDVVDLAAEVESFILAMRDSRLEEADRVVKKLKSTGTRARDYVQGLMIDEMPPTIESVPPPLMQGFLKALLERLS